MLYFYFYFRYFFTLFFHFVTSYVYHKVQFSACESLFSAAGRVFVPDRVRMMDDIVAVCLRMNKVDYYHRQRSRAALL